MYTHIHTHTHTYTHTLLKVKVVAQLCLALGDPMDCRHPGSSVHGILQARRLERVAMPSSRGSSLPRDWTRCPELQADSLLPEAPGKPYTDPYTHAQTHTCVGISSLFWDTPPGFLCLFQLYLSLLVFPLLHSPCGWVVFAFHDFKQRTNDTHMYIPAPAFPLNFYSMYQLPVGQCGVSDGHPQLTRPDRPLLFAAPCALPGAPSLGAAPPAAPNSRSSLNPLFQTPVSQQALWTLK